MRMEAGHVDEERHAHELFEDLDAVANHAVLGESLTVIAREDDRRPLGPRLLRDVIQEAPDLMIDVPNLAVVRSAHPTPEARCTGMLGVFGMRIEVVNPREESPRRVLGVREHAESRVGETAAG